MNKSMGSWDVPCKIWEIHWKIHGKYGTIHGTMGKSMEHFPSRHGGVGKTMELNGFSIFQQATCDYQKAYHLIPFLNVWTCDQLSRIRAGSLTNAIDRSNVVLRNVIKIKFTKIQKVFIKGYQSKGFLGFQFTERLVFDQFPEGVFNERNEV